MVVLDTYELAHRYTRDEGTVFLSGAQALARLPLEQLRADRRAGWKTAAYIAGYPGSPLAGYDRDVAAAAALGAADGLTMVVQPALNEELAATAVMGSQLAVTVGSCRYDGIVGIWYGKSPGLDRASDAIRHAVFAGTSPRGGAVALVGDDPSAKSSTLPSSSDASLIDLQIPVLHPGDVQEAIDLGRHAVALSRAAGLWTAIKVVESVADGSGTVQLHPDRIAPVMPVVHVDGKPWLPRPTGHLLTPHTLELEREFHEVRMGVARMYGVENRLNTVEVRGSGDWIGIVASGHTYHETMEALRVLGLHGHDALRNAGIRVLKLGLPVPLDRALVREFADGLDEVLVIEEKQPLIEMLVKDALYDLTHRPLVTGKQSPDGRPLVAADGALEADAIAAPLRARLSRISDRLTPPPPERRELIALTVNRTPYFCSGCPHNTSTKVPDGTLIGAGIGCHSMVMMMDEERVGDIVGLTAMGNEGAQWFGMSPFVDEPHLLQNLGDGTLFHSGILAVRAAAANGVNITYKVLYNGAVAMTGGQDPMGGLDVPALVTALLAEGVKQIVITTDEVSKYRDIDLPAGVKVWGRTRVVEAQELLATVPGCTVLIHDQRCAAEKRRDRKRGRVDNPAFKVLINERVCEGCGDCGDVSNCLSVQPVDTEFGRKTRIDQSSCNFDLSCMQGDCPSFAAVFPSSRSRGTQSPVNPQHIPVPASPDSSDECTIRLSGIGGTGVVTVSQILGTAAMLDGYHVRGLDQTGLSQKAGPVVSDLRLSRTEPRASNKATHGSVDVLIAFDELVAGSDRHLKGATSERTVVVASSSVTPTGSMVVHPDLQYPGPEVAARLHGSSRRLLRVDAQRVVEGLLGDESTANVFMLGVATQSGHVPVSVDAIEHAISLNGVAVHKNLAAFAWGRNWVVDEVATMQAAGLAVPAAATPEARPLVDRLAADLVDYQSERLAGRYRSVVDLAAGAGAPLFTEAVARHLHKLMAYKDEYEVARLLLLPESRAAAEAVGGPGARVQWHLHPPLLRALGMRRKLKVGRAATPVMMWLRAMRKVRGTPLDVFGLAHVRRLERRLVHEYVSAVEAVVPLVDAADAASVAEAVAIASLPDRVRGYERLKIERAAAYRVELARRVEAFTASR